MSRRFLVAVVCLSTTVGALLSVVIGGSFSPAPAISSPRVRTAVDLVPHTTSTRADRAPSFADIAERINPAVVNIDALSYRGFDDSLETSLRDGREPRDRPLSRENRNRVRRGTGAGFLIDADGYILTNQHIVEHADRLTVRLTDGRNLRARVIGIDADTDIALIKVDAATPLPFAVLGNSDELRVGEWVVAIGNPLTYDHTVTAGVVSFIGRKLFNTSLDRYIQTDAAIYFGNSGGPLIDSRGEVVGINAALSSRAANIGFAIPINQARTILPQLRKGHVTRGYIGIGLRDVDPDLQRSLRLPVARGALVQEVSPGAPGARAGVRVYDVITAVDGRPIDGNDQLIHIIAERSPGSTATLQLLRDGRPLSLLVKLAERPQADAAADNGDAAGLPSPSGRQRRPLGLMVRGIDADFASRVKLPADMRGVVVSRVEPVSPAFDAQLQQGQIVLEINRQPVRSVREFERLIDNAVPGDALTFYLYQPDRQQHLLQTVTLD